MTTVAGCGESGQSNGVGTNARFSSPFDIVQDSAGRLIVSDENNNKLRLILTSGWSMLGFPFGPVGGAGVANTLMSLVASRLEFRIGKLLCWDW